MTLHEPTIATDELRPTHIEVDLDVLAANYRAIAAHVAPARVMPILKANAYGHGLVQVRASSSGLAHRTSASPIWKKRCACDNTASARLCWCSAAFSARRSRAFSTTISR